MRLLKKITLGMSTAIAYIQLSAMQVFANDETGGWKAPDDAAVVLQNAGSNNSVSTIGDSIKGVVNSVYQGAVSIGIIIALIALVVGCIRLGVNKNSQKRDMGKDTIIWACVALFLFGGAVALIGAALNVGANAK